IAAAASNPDLLVLRAGIFDPADQQLRAAEASLPVRTGGRYAVVQFEQGRRLSPELLRKLGAEVVEYVPNNAYLVRLVGDDAALRARGEVRYVGAWQPSWKIAPDLSRAGADATALTVDVFGFRGEQQDAFAALVRASVRSAEVGGGGEVAGLPHVWIRVPAGKLPDVIAETAILDEVSWLARFELPHLHNRDSLGPIQSNQASSNPPTADQTSIWTKGLTGSNQIVALADSGLDRNQEFFINLNKGAGVVTAVTNASNTTPPALGAVFPNNKIYGYFVEDGASPYDDNNDCGGGPTSFHGTHTSGTVVGDAGTTATPTSGGWTAGDGMAPNAQLLFQDIGNDTSGCLSGVGGTPMWTQAVNAGAFISSNSYGSGFSGAYTSSDAEVDESTWLLEGLMIAFSAGNDGAAGVGHPGHSKNALTVGALGHGNSIVNAGFSSQGPASDGRRKPDIQAPGSSIVSAAGNDEDALANGGATTRTLSGTSMSTPTVAGGAALMRQYFYDGYYPSGVKTAADVRNPTGSELKATLLNGTSFAPLGTPNNIMGWGRIWLDNNLYFAGGATDVRDLRNFAIENANGLATNDVHTYTVQVPAGQEFRATLVWADPPALLAAGASLVNNLDLEVQEGANVYKGNVLTGTSLAATSTTGGTADAINNVEQVRFPLPTAGTYTIRVKGTNVPGNGLRYTTRQGYALAVSSAQCATTVAAAPSAPTLTPGASGVQVVSGAAANATSYQVYRSAGTCASADPRSFQLVGTSATPTFLDTHAQGGVSYAYKVRGADTCGEGPIGACQDTVSTAACTLLPTFNERTLVATNAATSTCGVTLDWSDASAACPGTTVRYNVYRSTDPFFTPAAANRIATGITTSNYADSAIDPLTTYYYAVKAEDTTTGNGGPGGGNETPELYRAKATATGPTSSPGTFADGADSPSFLLTNTTWNITNDRAFAGTLSYRNAPDGAGTYRADTCASLETPALQLQAGATLSYQARWNVEQNFDGVVTEISTDGGSTWADLPPSGGYPSSFSQTGNPPINACGFAASRGAYSGSSGGAFSARTSSLAAFAGQSVKLRWRFSSDPGAEEEGFYLDAVQVTNATVPG
ncbi:MAG TPA: S8 family serine peptidase, partial [Xanthomonadales bacterium]|nr:S8 family serine peptidase [Xanthomonadales bacterium]